MTKIDLSTHEISVAREAIGAYADNLETQLRNVKMTRDGELFVKDRVVALRAVLKKIQAPKPAPKPRKPRKPAAGK